MPEREQLHAAVKPAEVIMAALGVRHIGPDPRRPGRLVALVKCPRCPRNYTVTPEHADALAECPAECGQGDE